MTNERPRTLTGRHVLVWFLSFFLVVIGVNVVMSYFAIKTFSGVETEDAYRKGRDYNLEIEQARAQAALGWQTHLVLASGPEGEVATVTFTDKVGEPLIGLKLAGVLFRPVREGMDVPLVFEDRGNGTYQAAFEVPSPGRWQINLTAETLDGMIYRLDDDVYIKPE